MAWIIAPALTGVFTATVFLIIKYDVLIRQKPRSQGSLPRTRLLSRHLSPHYHASGLEGWLIRGNLTDAQIPLVIVMVGIGFGLSVAAFFIPWLYRAVVKEAWQLKWHHIF